jgi:uncharacterized protein (TIGR02453 family)
MRAGPSPSGTNGSAAGRDTRRQAPISEFRGFTAAAQRFFRDLARNNDKTWFEGHRSTYEQAVREPMKALVQALDGRLGRLAPEITGDPRRSLFRIHRDIRFSKDKSPYKTNAGCWFFHRAAGRGVGQEGDGGGAGFYFHLDAAHVFVAGGLWMPARPALNRVRAAIADDPGALPAIVEAPGFRRRFGPFHAEARLTRVPRGYPQDHPAADLLRYQSFTAGRQLGAGEIRSAALVDHLARDFERLLPLVRWLNLALGYAPARRPGSTPRPEGRREGGSP